MEDYLTQPDIINKNNVKNLEIYSISESGVKKTHIFCTYDTSGRLQDALHNVDQLYTYQYKKGVLIKEKRYLGSDTLINTYIYKKKKLLGITTLSSFTNARYEMGYDDVGRLITKTCSTKSAISESYMVNMIRFDYHPNGLLMRESNFAFGQKVYDIHYYYNNLGQKTAEEYMTDNNVQNRAYFTYLPSGLYDKVVYQDMFGKATYYYSYTYYE